VLFDELEKAHRDVTGILLQIMEEGVLTDSTGRRVSMKNAIVVMTANTGSHVKGEGLGFCPSGRKEEMQNALQHAFSPEFLGRIDAIVHFAPLEKETMEAIAGKYLHQLSQRAAELGVTLELPEQIEAFLCRGCDQSSGARQLRQLVQKKLESPLAEFLLRCGEKPGALRVEIEGAGVVIHK
jgi:ATP-dependent Clp protease ATP-binding subunit ClpA